MIGKIPIKDSIFTGTGLIVIAILLIALLVALQLLP